MIRTYVCADGGGPQWILHLTHCGPSVSMKLSWTTTDLFFSFSWLPKLSYILCAAHIYTDDVFLSFLSPSAESKQKTDEKKKCMEDIHNVRAWRRPNNGTDCTLGPAKPPGCVGKRYKELYTQHTQRARKPNNNIFLVLHKALRKEQQQKIDEGVYHAGPIAGPE